MAHCVVGLGHVEQVGFGIDHRIQDGKGDIDDVLVARKHQARLRAGAGGAADRYLAFLNHRFFHGFDRPEVEMQTRHGDFLLGLAEPQLHATFVWLDRIKRLHEPESYQRERRDYPDQRRTRPAAAAGHGTPQAVLPAPDHVFKIGRATAATAAARSAGISLPPRSA